ncbi:S1 family peptidase [Streptomyces sp. NK08204]|uniref:S1 family peptidase n=1 Tax=Streptomyces sp. NK08204 TaxID=2873260 RepID=UPI001CED7785|nr:S1 family peptidase [Streptomyces sp. NK08204]
MSRMLASTGKTLVAVSLLGAALTVAPEASAHTEPAARQTHDVPVAGGPSGDASQKLADRLGISHTAGIYLDRTRRRFVVTVTDDKTAQAVKDAGAIPRRVAYDTAYLNGIKTKLDAGFRTPGTMWGVDIPANQVVVRADSTVKADDFAALKKFVAPYGKAARVVRMTGRTERTAGAINGGDYIENGVVSCSYGFTVRSKTDSSYKAFLTAGHCTNTSGTDWRKSDGTYIGYTTGHNVANGNDFGLVRAYNANVTYYGNVEGANGVSQDITYSRDSKVYETVCASGYRSGYGCGELGLKNQTINYTDGMTVTGMDVASICRNHGDSGGPLYAQDAALGLLSGSNDSECFSYYQPVNEALAWYGMEVF